MAIMLVFMHQRTVLKQDFGYEMNHLSKKIQVSLMRYLPPTIDNRPKDIHWSQCPPVSTDTYIKSVEDVNARSPERVFQDSGVEIVCQQLDAQAR